MEDIPGLVRLLKLDYLSIRRNHDAEPLELGHFVVCERRGRILNLDIEIHYIITRAAEAGINNYFGVI